MCITLASSPLRERPSWTRKFEWRPNKELVIKEVSPFLLITPWTAVSTGRSYSSTLRRVEQQNRCILVQGAGVAKTGRLCGGLCAASGVRASWAEKTERTSRRWRMAWGTWDRRAEWSIRGRKSCHTAEQNNTTKVRIGKEQEEDFWIRASLRHLAFLCMHKQTSGLFHRPLSCSLCVAPLTAQ